MRRHVMKRGEKMKNKVCSLLVTLILVVTLYGCAADQEEDKPFEPTPLIIEEPDIKETEAFKKTVSAEVRDILNGEIVLTVYADGTEDFCYRGRVTVVNDGSDGTEVILFIYADNKTMLDRAF